MHSVTQVSFLLAASLILTALTANCRANQLTGFYTRATLASNELLPEK